jgi:hypothetical protein
VADKVFSIEWGLMNCRGDGLSHISTALVPAFQKNSSKFLWGDKNLQCDCRVAIARSSFWRIEKRASCSFLATLLMRFWSILSRLAAKVLLNCLGAMAAGRDLVLHANFQSGKCQNLLKPIVFVREMCDIHTVVVDSVPTQFFQ